jgi:hypothetical protein
MKTGHILCDCGHWSDRHFEEWNEETDESFYKCAAGGCDCDDFRHDAEGERDRENEARQLRYDVERGK